MKNIEETVWKIVKSSKDLKDFLYNAYNRSNLKVTKRQGQVLNDPSVFRKIVEGC